MDAVMSVTGAAVFVPALAALVLGAGGGADPPCPSARAGAALLPVLHLHLLTAGLTGHDTVSGTCTDSATAAGDGPNPGGKAADGRRSACR
jgi:hypothetical protein